MIKEIIDIGRVSNRLGSVFTFKGLPEYYVEIILEWNGKDFKYNDEKSKIRHLSEDKDYDKLGNELYLKYGVHRGKKSNILYIFPSSFIYENKEKTLEQIINFLVMETKYHKVYEEIKKNYFKGKKVSKKDADRIIYPEIIKMLIDNKIPFYPRITKYFKAILSNIDKIDELANLAKSKIKSELKGKIETKTINELCKKIPIIITIQKNNKQMYFYKHSLLFKVFENIEFNNSAKLIKKKNSSNCNIYTNKKAKAYPSGGFYYPFSTDKNNVKYNLKDDENLFLLSKEAYIDFMIGRTFLETHNNFYFMGLYSYITATSLNDNVLKSFQNDIKESKSNLDGLINLIDKNISNPNRFDILLNFYFWEPAKTGGGKEIIEFVKDIIPSQLVLKIKLFEKLKDSYKTKFNKTLNIKWQQHIYNIFYKDSNKKFRTSLFRKIALGDKIDINRLMIVMNENMQYSISKSEDSKDKYYYGTVIKHLLFLNWINEINKGEIKMNNDEKSIDFFVGQTYEEKLTYFLNNANLVKDSPSMKLGVCVGLSLQILSWSINGYDKKILSFVGKRIERNNLNSVEAFMNEIFAKTKFHEYEGLQSINIKLATMQMIHLTNVTFNKDEFIFGLFLGNELYNNVKSEQDSNPQNEGENNE
ncbi:hypothetical protein [Lebetimonas sp. JS138]|uniref:hypothetical protein n=2 Tax=unclassified Lebetimonas TaxID=2648158 RepID=UPI000463CBF5|nr:hypothetical protein [Lebetimonas sp. JS138]